jgi:uncharacterized protein
LILVDTSGLLALLDEDSRLHQEVAAFVATADDALVLSPFVLAELDYLIVQRFGIQAELALLGDVAKGAYELVAFTHDDIARAKTIVERYRDFPIGLTDASIVVLADARGTNRVLTLDERHFRVLKLKRGRPFVVLPAEAD